MTFTDQQIAFCEWLGWTGIRTEVWDCELGMEATGIDPILKVRQPLRRVDIESLDIMHGMRQRLTPEQRESYTSHRWKICRRTSPHIVTDHDMWKFANFDATQDREAILKALGLWKD